MSIKQTRQERHSEEMKNRIITTAKELFARYGFQKVSVRDIAEAAEVTTGTLYYYFKNKDDILEATYHNDNTIFESRLKEKIEQAHNENLIEYFFCELMVDQILKDGLEFARYRFFVLQKHFTKESLYYQLVCDMIEKEKEKRRYREDLSVEEIADYLLLIYRATTLEWCYEDGKYELRENMKNNIRIAMSGLEHR